MRNATTTLDQLHARLARVRRHIRQARREAARLGTPAVPAIENALAELEHHAEDVNWHLADVSCGEVRPTRAPAARDV